MNIGDVIAIYRYEDKSTNDPSAVGVVMKVYDEKRAFVRLLRNYTIPKRACQNWRVLGINNLNGYYLRREDKFQLMCKSVRTTYKVSGVIAPSVKNVTVGGKQVQPPTYYNKSYPAHTTDVYTVFNSLVDVIPNFVMLRDTKTDRFQVCVQRGRETVTEVARRAHARMQIAELEGVAK